MSVQIPSILGPVIAQQEGVCLARGHSGLNPWYGPPPQLDVAQKQQQKYSFSTHVTLGSIGSLTMSIWVNIVSPEIPQH